MLFGGGTVLPYLIVGGIIVLLLAFPLFVEIGSIINTKIKHLIATTVPMLIGGFFALLTLNDFFNFNEPPSSVIILGALLYIITFVSFISRRNWSIIMSIITIVFLNSSILYQMYVLPVDVSIPYMIWLFMLLVASSINADYLSKMKDDKNKVLWMKINQNPTKRDNTLFKTGCAIAAVAMGLSLTLPFFSINIGWGSESFSIIDASDTLRGIFQSIGVERFENLTNVALGLLVFYIAVLFLLSFSNSKAKKVMMGITVALSIYTIVFGTQAIIRSAIEDVFSFGQPQIDNFGMAGFITNSIFGVFGSIFRLEFGVIVLVCALVAYILFASCQFGKIGRPKLAFPNGLGTPAIKVRCGECNALNDDNAAFCSGCGKPLIKKQEPGSLAETPITNACVKCGAKLENNIKFCNCCGTPTKLQDTDLS